MEFALVDTHIHFRLFAPDDVRYYECTYDVNGLALDTWHFVRIALGKNNVYNVDTNPEGQWVEVGDLVLGPASWDDLAKLEIDLAYGQDHKFYLDGLCFSFGRWRFNDDDAASQASYGIQDAAVMDNQLQSDAECEARATAMIYQQKDPVTRIDMLVAGNKNILRGDRLSITLPAEAISAANYYVTGVEHHLNTKDGWTTTATMVNTVNNRNVPALNEKEVVLKEIKRAREIGRGIRKIT
jgi:hypothetical protein